MPAARVLALLLAAPQDPEPAPSASPDLEITATVEFEELRFEQVGETSVTFRGSVQRETESGTDRVNLPDAVEADVTYRDGAIRLRITSRFSELLRAIPEPAEEDR